MLRFKLSTNSMALARTKFGCLVFGLTFLASSISSFGQTASYHDHNIFHGAGSAYVNTSPEAQNVGAGGTLRAQLIWNIMPGQVKGGDLDLHTKAPDGQGSYTVTQFDPLGAVAADASLRNPPFGSPNTSPTGNQQVNWVNRQVLFANGNSVATLDTDNRSGVPNSPSGSLVENVYYGGTSSAPGYIPSGKYQFAVHNFNYTGLTDPKTDYALWITTNGKVGVRSEGHFRGTGQEPGKPGLPVWVGQLQNQGQSSQVYEVEIVNPGVEPHHAGIQVVDQKQKYRNDWFAYQRAQEARRKYLAELAHQQVDDAAATRAASMYSCPPAPMMCDLTSLYKNPSIENLVNNTPRKIFHDNFGPPPAPERYAVKIKWADYNTNWLGYAYIEGTREETLYFNDKATAEKVAKGEAEKWGIIDTQQQYEKDHALAYGTIKGVSVAAPLLVDIASGRYQKETAIGAVQGLYDVGYDTVTGVYGLAKYYASGQAKNDLNILMSDGGVPEFKYLWSVAKDEASQSYQKGLQGLNTYGNHIVQGEYREASRMATPVALSVVPAYKGFQLLKVGGKIDLPDVPDVKTTPDQPKYSINDRRQWHNQKVDEIKDALRAQGYTVNDSPVSFKDSCSSGRCIPDIIATDKNGKIKIIEIKTGDAQKSIRQTDIFPQIENGEAIPVGYVAETFGFKPGIPLKDQGYPDGIPIEIEILPGL